MSTLVLTGILKGCAAAYLLVIVIEWWTTRRVKRFLLELVPLAGLVLLDVCIASYRAGYITFGPDGLSLSTIGVMFFSIALGVSARYIFYLRGSFSWLDFAKPLCISPILLIPLIGSLQSVKTLEPTQIVSFALLAFQNGFFWQSVLQRTAPKK